MVIRRKLLEQLSNEGHYFNAAQPRKRLVPAGPDHAQIAAARGIAEYFDALDARHGGGDASDRPARVRELLRKAELPLLQQLLDYLSARKDVRLLGSANADERAATVAFVPHSVEPSAVAAKLARSGIMAASGHCYAVRLLEAMNVDTARGAVRVSLVHYNSQDEMNRLLRALDLALE